MVAVFTITALAIISYCQLIFVTDAKKCVNPPPGIPKMFRGIDITKVDLLPLDKFANEGFGSPVVKYTCDNGDTWQSPNGKTYEKPDQIWHINSLPGGWMSSETELYRTSQELKTSFGVDVGLEASYKKFAFSSSVSYTKMQSTLTNSSKFISDVGAFVSANTVEMNPNVALTLDDYTKAVVDKELTGTYESNPNAYNKFIDTFGTHFFYRANFGGYIRAVIQTSTNYLATTTEDTVKVNAKATYMSAISVTAGVTNSNSKVDEKFRETSSTSIRYYGGNTNLLDENKRLTDWQPTVANDPWLFTGKIRPISDLFTDPVKKSSMERAVEQYVQRNYLGELERLVYFAKSKSSDPIVSSLQTRVQNLKGTKVLVIKDVESLGSDIEYQINPSRWFKEQTKLCYKWSAESDGSQCGGGVPYNLCAVTNSMTQHYFDNTDNRAGGCRMEWGIFSTGVYPDWFNQVQMCFQYAQTSSDDCAGQCVGSGPGKPWCAKLNTYTPTYLDSTYNGKGGCIMQWKIQVPSNAPLWMKTAQMCFSWYAVPETPECGGGAPRDICVSANEWTTRYVDDTYDWGGGCMMSWGIKTVLN